MTSAVVDRASPRSKPPLALNVVGGYAAGFGVPTLSVLALILLVDKVDPARIGGAGLLPVVPWPFFVAVIVLTASFAWQVWRGAHGVVLAAHLAAAVFALHGIAALMEELPRFPTAYLHVGFVSVYSELGHGLTSDARFFWPAFFSTVAAGLGLADQDSAMPLLRYAPVVFNLAYLLPLMVLLRPFVASRTTRWLILWLFVLLNWVGQDYFAPQALGEFLLLAVLALTVTLLARVEKTRSLSGSRVVVLLLIVATLVAVAMEHPFTPIVLTVELFGLLAARRLRHTSLPWISAAIALTWISYAAEPYWIGHLHTLVGSGSVTQNVHSSVVGRVSGSSSHEYVVWVRLALTGLLWLASAAGAARLLIQRRRIDLACLLLAVLPFGVLIRQAYGGEAVLRVYLYTLPFMLVFAASLFVGRNGEVDRRRLTAFAVVCSLLVPAFLVARFGNEQFEQIRPAELAAVQELYRIAPPGATIAAINPNLPWRYTHFADYRYRSNLSAPVVNEDTDAFFKSLGQTKVGTWLIVTNGELERLHARFGGDDWASRVPAYLERIGFRAVFDNGEAQIYTLDPQVTS